MAAVSYPASSGGDSLRPCPRKSNRIRVPGVRHTNAAISSEDDVIPCATTVTGSPSPSTCTHRRQSGPSIRGTAGRLPAPHGAILGSMDANIRRIDTTESGQSVRMTADRILVRKPGDSERSTKTGLLIPATAASVNKRCIWSEVVAVGPNVRAIEVGDNVLHLPDGGLEVEVRGEEYILLRERDIHAVASDRSDAETGLYL